MSKEIQHSTRIVSEQDVPANITKRIQGETNMTKTTLKSFLTKAASFAFDVVTDVCVPISLKYHFNTLQEKKVSELSSKDIHFVARFKDMEETILKAETNERPLSLDAKNELLLGVTEPYEALDTSDFGIMDMILHMTGIGAASFHADKLKDKLVSELSASDAGVLVHYDLHVKNNVKETV